MAVNPRKGIYELRIIRIRSLLSNSRHKGTISPHPIHKIKDNRNLYQERWGYEVEGAGFQAGEKGEIFAQKFFFFHLEKDSHSS